MVKASIKDKQLVVSILTASFWENKSINYVVGNGKNKLSRMRRLMEYCFDTSLSFGEVYLSNDRKGCALILYPEKSKSSIRTTLLQLRLAFYVIGIFRIHLIIKREKIISALQPRKLRAYLWYIGVDPGSQKRGIGSALLAEIIQEARHQLRIICLETSVLQNLTWYGNNGFHVYHTIHNPYKLYLLSNEE